MIHVYAFVDPADGDPPPTDGLDGRPVEAVVAPGPPALAAVVTRHEDPLPASDLESLRRHEAVTRALMNRPAVVPARFGTRYRDDRELVRALDRSADRIAALMDRVRGRVEVGVRVGSRARHGTPPTGGATGRQYLAARAEAFRDAERDHAAAARVEGDLVATLRPWAEEVSGRVHPDAATAVAVAALVRVDDLPAVREAVQRFRDANRDADVAAGRWPPYSFTADALAAPHEVTA